MAFKIGTSVVITDDKKFTTRKITHKVAEPSFTESETKSKTDTNSGENVTMYFDLINSGTNYFVFDEKKFRQTWNSQSRATNTLADGTVVHMGVEDIALGGVRSILTPNNYVGIDYTGNTDGVAYNRGQRETTIYGLLPGDGEYNSYQLGNDFEKAGSATFTSDEHKLYSLRQQKFGHQRKNKSEGFEFTLLWKNFSWNLTDHLYDGSFPNEGPHPPYATSTTYSTNDPYSNALHKRMVYFNHSPGLISNEINNQWQDLPYNLNLIQGEENDYNWTNMGKLGVSKNGPWGLARDVAQHRKWGSDLIIKFMKRPQTTKWDKINSQILAFIHMTDCA